MALHFARHRTSANEWREAVADLNSRKKQVGQLEHEPKEELSARRESTSSQHAIMNHGHYNDDRDDLNAIFDGYRQRQIY